MTDEEKDQIIQIKLMLADGVPNQDIAEQLGVNSQFVARINNRQIHRDVVAFRHQVVKTNCINCGKVLYDEGVESDVIFRVIDNTYICPVKCEAELIRAER